MELQQQVNIVEFHERYFFKLHIIIRGVAIWNSTNYMKINEAILKRITELCEEKNQTICKASLNGGKSPSALYDLATKRTKCPKVITIKCFCDGVDITLSEFFDREYFNNLDDDD